MRLKFWNSESETVQKFTILNDEFMQNKTKNGTEITSKNHQV